MEGQYNEQAFLNRLIAQEIPVTVYMTNGFQMRGTVAGYDAATIVVTCDGQNRMLYKHAVSTFAPNRHANPGSEFLPRGN